MAVGVVPLHGANPNPDVVLLNMSPNAANPDPDHSLAWAARINDDGTGFGYRIWRPTGQYTMNIHIRSAAPQAV